MGGGRIFSDRVEPGAPGWTASWPTPHPPTRKIKQREAEGLSDRPNLIVCSAFADVRVVRNRLRRACQEAFAGPVRSSSVCSAFTPCEISASSAPASTRAIGRCARPILLRVVHLLAKGVRLAHSQGARLRHLIWAAGSTSSAAWTAGVSCTRTTFKSPPSRTSHSASRLRINVRPTLASAARSFARRRRRSRPCSAHIANGGRATHFLLNI